MFQPLNKPVRNWQQMRIWLIGASSGIGEALARNLACRGAQLILSARRAELLTHLAQEISVLQDNPARPVLVLPFDVCTGSAWQEAASKIEDHCGGIDLVFFCAANYHPERSWQVEPEQAAQTLNVNLHSVYRGLYALLPQMLARGSGGIALVASVAGYMGLPNASVYGPSKAALINLAELLYSDLHAKGINVYLINPGFVQTELTAKNDFPMPALQTPQQAATAIISGLESGQFEIHFPRRFTRLLKIFKLLPYRWRFAVLHRLSP